MTLSSVISAFLSLMFIFEIREGVLKHFADFLSVMSEKKRDEHLATLWKSLQKWTQT
eukprot:UN09148